MVDPDQVEQTVRSRPGMQMTELIDRLDAPRHVVQRMLQHLFRDGRLARERLFGYTCWFPAQTDPEHIRAAKVRLALRSDAARAVLRDLCVHPQTSFRDVAERTGVKPAMLSYHLDRLCDAGLAERMHRSRTLQLMATPSGFAAAARVAEKSRG